MPLRHGYPGDPNPQGIVIQGDRLYVANGPFGSGSTGSPSIAVFALPLAAGTDNVALVAVLAGPATALASPFGLVVNTEQAKSTMRPSTAAGKALR